MLEVCNVLAFPIEFGVELLRGWSYTRIAAHGSEGESRYFFTLPEIWSNGNVKYRPIIDSSAVEAEFQPLGHIQDLLRGEIKSSPSSKVDGLVDGVQQTCSQFKKLNFHCVVDLRAEKTHAYVLSIVPAFRIHNLVPVPIKVRLTSITLTKTSPCNMALAPDEYAAVDCVSRLQNHRADCRLQLAIPSVGLKNWSEGGTRLHVHKKKNDYENAITLRDGKGGKLHVLMKTEFTNNVWTPEHLTILLYVRCCLINRTGLQLELGDRQMRCSSCSNQDVIHARNSITLKRFASESADILQTQTHAAGESSPVQPTDVDDHMVLLSPQKWQQKQVAVRLRIKGSTFWSEKKAVDNEPHPGLIMVEGLCLFVHYLEATCCMMLPKMFMNNNTG